jgi:hypothetical protein
MPFNIGQSINNVAAYVVHDAKTKEIFRNPIYIALMIIIIIMLLIIVVFRHSENDDPLWTMSLRVGIYGFLVSVFLIFTHDKVSHAAEPNELQDLFNDKNMINGAYDDIIVPITNNLDTD